MNGSERIASLVLQVNHNYSHRFGGYELILSTGLDAISSQLLYFQFQEFLVGRDGDLGPDEY